MQNSELRGFDIVTDTTAGEAYLVCTQKNPRTGKMCDYETEIEETTLDVVVELATFHNKFRRHSL